MINKLLRGAVAGGTALAAAVLLAGCGGGGATDNPARTAENFLHALAAGDPEQLCELIADQKDGPAEKDTPQWNECLSGVHGILAESEGRLAKYSEATVESAQIDGNEADVEEKMIKGVAEPDISIELTRFDDTWYVTDFS